MRRGKLYRCVEMGATRSLLESKCSYRNDLGFSMLFRYKCNENRSNPIFEWVHQYMNMRQYHLLSSTLIEVNEIREQLYLSKLWKVNKYVLLLNISCCTFPISKQDCAYLSKHSWMGNPLDLIVYDCWIFIAFLRFLERETQVQVLVSKENYPKSGMDFSIELISQFPRCQYLNQCDLAFNFS